MAATYAPPTEMHALRDYVTGGSRMQQTAESTVLVYLTHNHLKAQFPEIRLDLNVCEHLRSSCTNHALAYTGVGHADDSSSCQAEGA
jgi:hypothetical protein